MPVVASSVQQRRRQRRAGERGVREPGMRPACREAPATAARITPVPLAWFPLAAVRGTRRRIRRPVGLGCGSPGCCSPPREEPDGGGSVAWRPVGPDCGSYASLACSIVSVAVLCPSLPRPFQSCFRHCGSSASYVATFDPQSRLSDKTEGALSYFVVVEWAPPLFFPALAHDHAGAGVKADEKVQRKCSKAMTWRARSAGERR